MLSIALQLHLYINFKKGVGGRRGVWRGWRRRERERGVADAGSVSPFLPATSL